MKRVLTIAGSDSGGGAGIQADIKAITVLGEYALSVITALTAQNTLGVQGIHAVPPDFIALQMESVLSDIGADAAKTGMLANAEIVRVVAGGLKKYRVSPVVVDPVMVATSGDPLLTADSVEAVKSELLPLARVVTPNLREAAILAGREVASLSDMREAARIIHGFGPAYVLVKGGHFDEAGNLAIDLLFDGNAFETFEASRIDTKNTHGTGCTLSAALATYLAKELDTAQAVAAAKAFITEAIRDSLNIGGGHGPTNPYAHVANLLGKSGR